MYYIGIDLGTSAVKLLLMDADGNIQKIVSKEYPLYFPHPGWSEQNPEDWYSQTMVGLQELLKECDAGTKMAVSSIDEVLESVKDSELKQLLQSYLETIGLQIHKERK